MPLRARIALCLERFGFVRRRLTTESILEKTYQVVGGSTRTHDYDDAWILALGFDSRVVFDVGCNVGQSTLLLLHSDRIEQIVLIDPNPAALAIAAENLIRNSLSPRRDLCVRSLQRVWARASCYTRSGLVPRAACIRRTPRLLQNWANHCVYRPRRSINCLSTTRFIPTW